MKLHFLVGLLVLMTSGALADSIDDAEAKRRGITVETLQLERYKTLNADLQVKLAALQLENATLKKQVDQLKANIEDLSKKLAIITPSNDLAADGTDEITVTKLETMGEKYENKIVKMTDLGFIKADNESLDLLPGITISDNGLISRVNTREMENWIGFMVSDSNGRLFQRVYAYKKDYGELIVGLKRGQKINVRGVVLGLSNAGWYGLICTKIEVVPLAPAKDDRPADSAQDNKRN